MRTLSDPSPEPSLALGGRTGANPVLDGVRGLAILLVMICHMTILDSDALLDRLWLRIGFMGWIGVDLFFVLSGFLITGILHDARGAPHYFRNFYARRTLRIFPLYYLVIFTCLVFIPHVLPAALSLAVPAETATKMQAKIDKYVEVSEYKYWFWFYLCNVPMAVYGQRIGGVLSVCWSLAIEEQFYLVWPLVVRFASRRMLMRVCAGLFAFALVWRTALETLLPRLGWGPGSVFISTYVSTFSHVDALATGAFLALLLRGPGVDLAVISRIARLTLLTCAPIVVVIAVAETWGPHYRGPDGPFVGQTPVFLTLGLTLLSCIFGSLLVLALTAPRQSTLHRIFAHRWLRTLGKYAYAMYLFHWAIRAVVASLVFGPFPTARIPFPIVAGSQAIGQLLFYPLCMGLTLAAAWLSWRLFENPILRLKRYFPSGNEQGTDTARVPDAEDAKPAAAAAS